jgi:hypothetical protein
MHTDNEIVSNPAQRIKAVFIRLASWLAVIFGGAGMSGTTEQEKQFTKLRAQLALKGHPLHRNSSTDGTMSYFPERWVQACYLPVLDDAQRALRLIGGAHEL